MQLNALLLHSIKMSHWTIINFFKKLNSWPHQITQIFVDTITLGQKMEYPENMNWPDKKFCKNCRMKKKKVTSEICKLYRKEKFQDKRIPHLKYLVSPRQLKTKQNRMKIFRILDFNGKTKILIIPKMIQKKINRIMTLKINRKKIQKEMEMQKKMKKKKI